MSAPRTKEGRSKILSRSRANPNKLKPVFTMYKIHRWLMHRKWVDTNNIRIPQKEFLAIIRRMNTLLYEGFLQGKDVKFPLKMGALKLIKLDYLSKIQEDGSFVTLRPIDWKSTHELWEEDEEAYNERLLVRVKDSSHYKVWYDKFGVNCENKKFLGFLPARGFRKAIYKEVTEGNLDTFALCNTNKT